MLRKDNQNSQNKIKGPLIFEDNKWNNIPECIISFFNIINAKIVDIETNHNTFKQKSDQNFTKQNQVINECKTIAEETSLNFNLTNQTLTANMKEIKNKCENQNTMMRIKMEEELDKLNKRLDDITRGVNMKIDDNNELLVLIKKEADQTKQMFSEAMEEQKNEQKIIDVVSASQQIVSFIKKNSGIEDQLKDLKEDVKKEARNTLNHLLDDEEDASKTQNKEKSNQNNSDDIQESGGLLKKIEKKILGKVEKELKQQKEIVEKNQVITNDLILTLDKDFKKAKEQIEQISSFTRKYEKERKSMDTAKLESKYGMLESQLSNFNENFEKIQENMNLISNTLSHKLNDKIKQRSITPTQFSNMAKQGGADSTFTQKINDIPSSHKSSEQISSINYTKQIELQIPTQNSEMKDETIQNDEETLEDKIQQMNQRISLLELQFNLLKNDQKDTNSEDENTVKKNTTEVSKSSLMNKPWLTGQEVILKEGDNLAIKVFQKSQSINKKNSKYSQMYENPQVLAKKYRNSILGQDVDQIKVNGQDTGIRSNSHTKIKEIVPNPSNMTAYYKQNYMYDSSPEKSKKNSFSGQNSTNDLQFTNDLIKSQLDNYTHKAKQQLESMKSDMNWIEGGQNNQSEVEVKQIIGNSQNNNLNANNQSNNNLPPPPRSRNSRTFHSVANTAITSTTSYNLLNQSADQSHISNIHTSNNISNPQSMPQTGTNQFAMTQNANNFQPQKQAINQNESPLNSYKIAKNVMKNTKIKSFRISQGVSFDAINLNKY